MYRVQSVCPQQLLLIGVAVRHSEGFESGGCWYDSPSPSFPPGGIMKMRAALLPLLLTEGGGWGGKKWMQKLDKMEGGGGKRGLS